MIRTITVDIINEKALNLLRDLELMNLIRVRKDKPVSENAVDWKSKFKGAMTKESLNKVDDQLNHLRSEWE